jgi:hypothetical protein
MSVNFSIKCSCTSTYIIGWRETLQKSVSTQGLYRHSTQPQSYTGSLVIFLSVDKKHLRNIPFLYDLGVARIAAEGFPFHTQF